MTDTSTPLRVLIVDDHPIVRQGYALLIGSEPDLEVCGNVGTAAEALELVKPARPDLAIVDITLRGGSGIDLLNDLRERSPSLKILIVSAHDELLYAERAIDAGAMGYVNKTEAAETLVEAIRTVIEGEVFVSESINQRWLKRRVGRSRQNDMPTIEALTNRELAVYEMIGQGRTTKQIAGELGLSPKTVERYKENIKQKLALQNATQLVQTATRWVLEKG